MNNTIKTALADLYHRHAQIWQQQQGTLPQQLFDAQWRSECEVEQLAQDSVTWSAVERDAAVNLDNIEEALEIRLHPSIQALFTSYFADGIPCLYEDHPVDLIQVWNEEDFTLLQENMIAHFMMQKRLKKPASMFIATCSDEMQVISILNDTGEVQLETLGKQQEAILAPDLATFLDNLQPVVKHQD